MKKLFYHALPGPGDAWGSNPPVNKSLITTISVDKIGITLCGILHLQHDVLVGNAVFIRIVGRGGIEPPWLFLDTPFGGDCCFLRNQLTTYLKIITFCLLTLITRLSPYH